MILIFFKNLVNNSPRNINTKNCFFKKSLEPNNTDILIKIIDMEASNIQINLDNWGFKFFFNMLVNGV